VRFEIPDIWVVEAADDCVKAFDRPHPDDDCVLAVSYHPWPAVGRNLALGPLVRGVLEKDERSFFSIDPLVEDSKLDFQLAWAQARFIDPRVNREACSRLCLARKAEIQALLTFDFWSSDLAACEARWNGFLATLQLGQWIEDPLRGPPLM
jgi:hypothetical protein